MHLTAKFYHSTFNRSEVIVLTNKLTNKQTPLKTSTTLRYATPVGNNIFIDHILFLSTCVSRKSPSSSLKSTEASRK